MLDFLKRLFEKTRPAPEKPQDNGPRRTSFDGVVPPPSMEQEGLAPVNPASITNFHMAGYPNAYRILAKNDREIARPEVFEPALKQYSRAFRLGDPLFENIDDRRAWVNTRFQVANHLLRMISGSRWKDHLVLRGSFLLKAWLGETAREPGDIDWVFMPANVGIDDPSSRELFDGLIQFASMQPCVGSATIEVTEITIDDIWTYERASGRRIVFPWRAQGLPTGEIQMDVVFGEELFTDPIPTIISSQEGENLVVLGASKEVSLAWKLLWLETDMLPQGKDLYDATLLAEQTRITRDLLNQVFRSGGLYRLLLAPQRDPSDLLNQVFRSGGLYPTIILNPGFPMKWNVDWENFKLEYPWVEGEAEDWQSRLSLALAPTFEA